MIPATSAIRPDVPVDLLAGYLDYVKGLDCAQQAKSLRRRGAIRFLDRFDDLDAWMARPTKARLDDTKRADAWPFMSWCSRSVGSTPTSITSQHAAMALFDVGPATSR